MIAPVQIARTLAEGGRAALEANRDRLNDMNVYPVPDGDTGTNLVETVRALAAGLAEPTLSGAGRAEVAHAAKQAALMGARGNSGVILSQIVRGFADSLASTDGRLGPHEAAAALRAAATCAYRAVRSPVEGTMLTVVREMAEEAERNADNTDLDELLALVVAAGERAVERTPELLDVLRRSGVVDAGAAGLVELVRGAVASLQGEAIGPASDAMARPVTLVAHGEDDSHYRYCTSFLVEGDEVDAEVLLEELEGLGDSLYVVGERPMFKVHVHTDDPGAALSLAVAAGTIDRVEIADMYRQTADRERRLSVVRDRPPTGVVAVVMGAGNEGAYRAAGVQRLVVGGQSMNPSAGEIAQAVEAADADGVLVLPNNRNVILAAEHAASVTARPARVVPTRSIAAGLLLLDAADPQLPLEANADRLVARNATVRHGEVAVAVRDAGGDGVQVREGQHITLVDGRITGAYDGAQEAADALADSLAAAAHRVLLLTGAETGFAVERWIEDVRRRHPDVAIELREGGQPLYPLLAAAEGAPLLTPENTAIVLDSTADLPAPESVHRNWRMVPLTVRFGEHGMLDFIELRPEEFYRRLESSRERPSTAAPAPGAYQAAFEELSGYARILVLPVSSKLSGSSAAAEVAARAVDPSGRRITVLDGGSVSGATLLLADGLQRLLVRGVAENALVTWFEEARERLSLLFSVETLEYLRRGGRIGRAKAAIGGLLRVRPLLGLSDGEVVAYGKVRGRNAVLPAFERFLTERVGEDEPARVAVVHARDLDRAQELRELVARRRPRCTVDHVVELGAVVGTHGGPGTLGMAVLREG
jgi:DAK2 domain fusion protein YloV